MRQQEAEIRCRTVHHRDSSGAVWRAWLMGRRQHCPDKSPKTTCDDYWPSFLLADRRKRTPGRVSGASWRLARFILTQNGLNVTRAGAHSNLAPPNEDRVSEMVNTPTSEFGFPPDIRLTSLLAGEQHSAFLTVVIEYGYAGPHSSAGTGGLVS